MKIFINAILYFTDEISKNYHTPYREYKYIRANNLSKLMYRGSIVEEKDGMLKIELPSMIFTAPNSGMYTIDNHNYTFNVGDEVLILHVNPDIL